MKRFYLIVFILMVIIAAASAVFGQTADEPWRDDKETEVGPATMSLGDPAAAEFRAKVAAAAAEPLQILLDGPEAIVDLGGQTYFCKRLTWTANHVGKEIINGRIAFELGSPGGQTAFIEAIRKKTYNGVTYPDGPIWIVLRNVELVGPFNVVTGLQSHTETLADAQGAAINLISNITYSIEGIILDNVKMSCSGNSGAAVAAKVWDVKNLQADKIAKHVCGFRGFGGVSVQVDGIVAVDCGNVFDFHNDEGFYNEQYPDYAHVDNVSVIRPTGGAKANGLNWKIYGNNWNFDLENVVNLNLMAPFRLAKRPRQFVLNGYTAHNFPNTGFQLQSDPQSYPHQTEVHNAHISGSLSAMIVQQPMAVYNSEFEGYWPDQKLGPYRSAVPQTQSNNLITSPQNSAYWANIYDQIEILYDQKNVEWGLTGSDAIEPNYWVPNAVKNLMTQD